ncbi:hypothetical protein AB0F52_09500 [Amycolatopsis sp. NPDC024027]|uniref:hypothetical protein n=1 Tax=Amycolatopsis sp. NPDC024027 TaxID=3154327 RepID=UPI00340BAF64
MGWVLVWPWRVGQGEVDWDAFFGTQRDIEFDGVATVCVFAWEERAVESSKFMLERVMTRPVASEPRNAGQRPQPHQRELWSRAAKGTLRRSERSGV